MFLPHFVMFSSLVVRTSPLFSFLLKTIVSCQLLVDVNFSSFHARRLLVDHGNASGLTNFCHILKFASNLLNEKQKGNTGSMHGGLNQEGMSLKIFFSVLKLNAF